MWFRAGLAGVCWLMASCAFGYVESRYTLPQVINESTNIVVMKVEKVHKERKLIYYTKVADLKGTHPAEAIKHNVGVGGFNQRERDLPIQWAEPGKLAIFFHNGGASETCIGTYWYQCYAGGEWWNHSHGEPYLCRSFCGEVEALRAAVEKLLKDEDVVIPCTVSKSDLRIQKVRASMKDPLAYLVVEPPKIEKTALEDVAGFAELIDLPRPEGQTRGAVPVDFDGDGFPDLLLLGTQGMRLLRNNREGNFEDVTDKWGLVGAPGALSAGFADYNRSGRPSLLTSAGKLYTNTGESFRDDSHLLPDTPKRVVNPGVACSWVDFDADGLPDILCSLGVQGLTAYRNTLDHQPGGGEKAFEDVSEAVGLGPAGLGTGICNYLTPLDLNGDGRSDFLLNLARGLAAVWDGQAFVGADLGLNFPGSVQPAAAYADYQNNGRLGLLITASDRTGNLLDWHMIGPFNNEQDQILEADGDFSPESRPQVQIDPFTWTWKPVRAKANGVLEIRRGFTGLHAAFAHTTFQWPRDEKALLHLGSGHNLVAWLNGEQVYVFGESRVFAGEVDHVEVELKEGANRLLLRSFDESPVWRTSVRVSPVGLYPPPSVQLYQSEEDGKWREVTLESGDLAQLRAECSSAAWVDLDNDNRLDLLVTARSGLLRVYLNRPDGTFQYATHELGIEQRFKAVAAVTLDINVDGREDLVLVGAADDPCVALLSKVPGKLPLLAVRLAGSQCPLGAVVQLYDQENRLLATRHIAPGAGPNLQALPEARFAVSPGTYRIAVRYSSGRTVEKQVQTTDQPRWETIETQFQSAGQ